MKTLILTALVLMQCAAAHAGIRANIDSRFGENGYRQYDAAVQLRLGGWSLRPAFSSTKDDFTNGTFRTYSGRIGYEAESLAIGTEAGMSPKTDGYAKLFAGADISYLFLPAGDSEPDGFGFAGLNLGLAGTYTSHRDDYQLTSEATSRSGRGSGSGTSQATSVRSDTLKIGQTDMSVFSDLDLYLLVLGGQFTKSVYDHVISSLDRDSPNITVSGLNHSTQGFPEDSWSAKLELTSLPIVRPFVSYSSTQIQRTPGRTKSCTAGLSLSWKMLTLRGSFEKFYPAGSVTGTEFSSAGVGMRF